MRTTTLNMAAGVVTLAADPRRARCSIAKVALGALPIAGFSCWCLIAAVTEIALLAGLDGLWMKVGAPDRGRAPTAASTARSDARAPGAATSTSRGSRTWCDLILAGHQPAGSQGANLYYASMHFTVMGILLFWLFWRHRDRYSGHPQLHGDLHRAAR